MSRDKKEGKKKTSPWLVIGFIVLVILLFVWLTIADLWGDTDVAADMISLTGLL